MTKLPENFGTAYRGFIEENMEDFKRFALSRGIKPADFDMLPGALEDIEKALNDKAFSQKVETAQQDQKEE